MRTALPPARLLALLLALLAAVLPASAQPLRLHPENPHYFLFGGRPAVLVTSGEHYGAVLNPDFDYETYLNTLAADGLNYTRIFTGVYFEPPGAFGIEKNTLAPAAGRALTPWARTTPGGPFDLDRWDDAYFRRLVGFVRAAAARGVVVEVTLFSSIYGDAQWTLHPFNPANNVNGTGAVTRQQVHTLHNGGLLAHQERMVRKVVRELNAFDNVFYELQNEPWADNGYVRSTLNPHLRGDDEPWTNRVEYPTDTSFAWQHTVAGYIQSEEAALPNQHLVALNYANFRYPVDAVDPAVSILNFHYASPEAVSLNYGWGRVVGLDETGFAGAADSTYRRQAWAFMLAGGALFNNLDYSFTVERPDGTDTNQAPGGGSAALRRQLGVLKRFIEGLDFVRMRPDPSVVVQAPGAFCEVLAEPGRSYALYVDGPLTGDLVLALPAGQYDATWVDVLTGASVEAVALRHGGGRATLTPPPFSRDIALRVVAAGP